MYENFLSLPEEKRGRILKACIEEFAQSGYRQASTNEIVKKAGISKGILFHYFGNKKNLFLFVIDHVLESATKRFYRMEQEPPADMFERILHRSMVKFRFACEEPLIYKILFDLYFNVPEELKQEVKEKYENFQREHLARFLEGIDTSKFRKNISVEKAVEVIILFLEAYSNRYIASIKDLTPEGVLKRVENIRADILEYFDILKKGIYEQP